MGLDTSVPTGKLAGMDLEPLRVFLNSLSVTEQESYAGRCDTTLGYLRKALAKAKRDGARIGESLAITLDRESGGAVPFERTRPDVDWAYVRKSSKRSARFTTSRKCG